METSQRAQEEPDYTKMTLEELGQSVITFGEAKKGQSYEKVLRGDQSYVTWFTTKFADSQKYPHRRFLFYVQKFVEQEETIQVTARPKSRPAPKSNPHMMVHLTDEDTPVPEVSDDENTMWDLIEGQRQQICQLENHQSQRINNLEVAMGQIVGQLQELTRHLKGAEEQ
jgi:hypothetical protein